MRKFVVIALGLAGIGASSQLAVAVQNCESQWQKCLDLAAEVRKLAGEAEGEKADVRCDHNINVCRATGKWANLPGKMPPEPQRDISNTADGVGIGFITGGGGGSKPKPGAHRTADGGIIMVTPEGKEWIWNGKYTTVQTVSHPGHQEYITVMQGDPNVTLTKVVNGRRYNVADPAYAAAIAAEQAKNSVVVHDHRTNKPPATSSGTTNNGGATHGTASGSAPSAAAPGSAGTTTWSGTIVRDHREGANNANSVPPAFAASGINKKPNKNAQ